MDANTILDAYNAQIPERTKWTGRWDDCARYCLPDVGPASYAGEKKQTGEKKFRPLNPAGIKACFDCASGIFSNCVSPGQEWFTIRLRKSGNGAMGKSALQDFSAKLSRETLEAIQNSNFPQVLQEMLLTYSCLGTGVVYSEMTASGPLTFRQFPINGNIMPCENERGMVDTLYREFEYTARQAVRAFGYALVGEKVQKAFSDASKAAETFKYLHAVFPRPEGERDPQKINKKNKRFASVYVDIDRKTIVLEEGYDSFPFAVPRFSKFGNEVFGRSPAMMALPALRTLNRATRAFVRNAEFAADPCTFCDTAYEEKLVIEPGAINPYSSTSGDGKPFLYSGSGNIGVTNDFCEKYERIVDSFFFADLFRMLENQKNMTAEEVRARIDEKIQSISPVISRLQSELFTPLLSRVAMLILERNGISDFTDYEIVYTSRLDSKLRQVQNANILTFNRQAAEVATTFAQLPILADYVKPEVLLSTLARNNNIEPDSLRTEQETADLQEARAKQQSEAAIFDKIKPIDAQAAAAPGSIQDAMQQQASV